MTKHTPGPWLVVMERNRYGGTKYAVMQHTHTLVAVEPEGYYAEGEYPTTDEEGIYLPDDRIDCSEHRVANARLIAAAPDLFEALQYAIKQVPELATVPGIAAAIAKATGEKP